MDWDSRRRKIRRLRRRSNNGFPADYLTTLEARIRAVTRAAVNQDILAGLPKPPLTAVMVAPSADGFGADCVIKALAEIARVLDLARNRELDGLLQRLGIEAALDCCLSRPIGAWERLCLNRQRQRQQCAEHNGLVP